MSNKIAKVLKVTHTGNKNGYNFWEVELAGGDKGGISGKKPDCYVKEGELIEYTMEAYSNGNPKINVINKGDYVKGAESQTDEPPAKNRNSPEIQTYIIRQSSLQRAVEICQLNGIKADLHTVCGIAEMLARYVLNGNIPAKKNTNTVTGQPAQTQEEINDLPF